MNVSPVMVVADTGFPRRNAHQFGARRKDGRAWPSVPCPRRRWVTLGANNKTCPGIDPMMIPALFSLLASAVAEPAVSVLSPCEGGPAPRLFVEKLEIVGAGERRVDIAARAGSPLFVIVTERGTDVRFQVLGPGGKNLANADNPIARSGVQSALVESAVPVTLLVQGKEHENHRGAVDVHVLPATMM